MCDESQPVERRVNPLWDAAQAMGLSLAKLHDLEVVIERFVDDVDLWYGDVMDMDETATMAEVVQFYLDRWYGNIEEFDPLPSPMEIAQRWYREDCIIDDLRRKGGVPTDVFSHEFAAWLTEQYQLAMAKGIQLARDEASEAFDADR